VPDELQQHETHGKVCCYGAGSLDGFAGAAPWSPHLGECGRAPEARPRESKPDNEPGARRAPGGWVSFSIRLVELGFHLKKSRRHLQNHQLHQTIIIRRISKTPRPPASSPSSTTSTKKTGFPHPQLHRTIPPQ
jgi:hypothetical protein